MKPSRPRDPQPPPADAAAIAAAAVRSWEWVESRLSPIIGEVGFRLLLARSLHRTRARHPWLARDKGPGEIFLVALRVSLDSESPERAAEGSRALTENFNELLNLLIGEELTARLLGPEMGSAVRDTNPEKAQ